MSLFEKEGILCKSVTVHCRQVENRSRSLVMNRFVPYSFVSTLSRDSPISARNYIIGFESTKCVQILLK